MANVSLKNIKKVYPFSGDDIKRNKKKAKQVEKLKKNPDAYKGHVGDVSTVIRVAVTGRRNTPDLYAIMSLLGEDKVKARLNDALDFYKA